MRNIGKLKTKYGTKKRKVNQYDLNGKFIKTFESLTEAAKSAKISRTMILLCCKAMRHSGAGYQWRYYDEEIGK